MSKLLTALIAAGFVFGVGSASAQDVKSDREKAKGQEETMQQKEQGTNSAAQGKRERPATNDGRSNSGDDATAAKDQSAPQNGAGAAADQSKPSAVPDQSKPSVGQPKEGQPTGQGQAVKKQNQSDSNSGTGMSNDDNSSGQAGTDQSDKKKRRTQQ
jgi:hypothetical protein